MWFARWDEENNTIKGNPQTLAASSEGWYACEMPDVASWQSIEWSFDGQSIKGKATGPDTADGQLVTKFEINAAWRKLERYPIKISGVWFDFDEDSRYRFNGVTHAWDALNDAELFTEKNGVKSIVWRDYFNQSQVFTRVEFEALYQALIEAAAKRSAALFKKAQSFKSDATTTRGDIKDEHWGIELLNAEN